MPWGAFHGWAGDGYSIPGMEEEEAEAETFFALEKTAGINSPLATHQTYKCWLFDGNECFSLR